jgi:arginase family enzyme
MRIHLLCRARPWRPFDGACNLCSESGVDLGAHSEFIDLGDMDIPSESATIEEIERTIAELLRHDVRIISLGGDHAITDLYDTYDGNRYSNACPFARIMEEKLVSRLVQVGIRTLNPHQKQQAQRFGVEIIDMQNLQQATSIHWENPVYLSIDLDVLDPAFAPGVSHHEPGGMSTRRLIDLIQRLQVPIAGADIVEFNPKRDSSEITAMAAVKILKEVASRMLELPIDLR